MKKQAYKIVTMIALITVVGLSSAKAQSNGAMQMTANIPFEFSVGGQILPSGEYEVRCTNPASDRKVLQLRSRDGRQSVLVQTNNVIGKMNDGARLVFNRYGDRHFFAQAWLAAESTGMQAPKSRNEKATAKELAGIPRKTELVTLTRTR